MNDYYVSLFPGLADVVSDEMREMPGVESGKLKRLRNAELLSVRADGPGPLLGLRTTEDVFIRLGAMTLTGRPDDLKILAKLPVFGGALARAMNIWATATHKTAPSRPVFRIVAQAEDVHWRAYRRVDMQTSAEAAVLRTHSGWRLSPDEAPIEIWLQQVDRELVIGLRLTSGVDRQHGGRAVERSAALRPSIAAAMVWLSQPEPGDVFLDPMCGTGTILLERAMTERYEMLVGGDIDKGAVSATLANFGPRHKPRRIEQWDARSLPLADDSINKIVCNLPWGRQVGEKAALPSLYEGFIKEAERVLVQDGRMVLLSSEWDVLKRAIKLSPFLKVERTVKSVEILGRRADIFVLEKHLNSAVR